jgi:hypothetical protein
VTLRPSAPYKKQRWLTLLAVVAMGTALFAGAVLADINPPSPPAFSFTTDQSGADDVPGQKDLSAHASVADGADKLWVAWKWDDTAWSGKNTGDACALFNTGGNASFVDFAVCVTVGGTPPTQLAGSPRIYTCGDGRPDRCTSPVDLVAGPYASSCIVINGVSDPFHALLTDTQATCHVHVTTDIGGLGASLINTCSYPSQEPNSDPSDCVLIVSFGTSVQTSPSGSVSWSATLDDSAAITPSGATGTVTFKLYPPSDASCLGTPIWTSDAIATVGSGGTGSTTGNVGSPTGGRTVSVAGTYHWVVNYSATGNYVSSDSACGEAEVVTAASTSP